MNLSPFNNNNNNKKKNKNKNKKNKKNKNKNKNLFYFIWRYMECVHKNPLLFSRKTPRKFQAT